MRQNRNVAAVATASPVNAKVASLLAKHKASNLADSNLTMAAIEGLVGYGLSVPLYDLVQLIAATSVIVNTVDTAFQGFAEAKAGLKEGEAGISYSEQYDAYTLAVKSNGAVFFFSLLHDAEGNPVIEDTLILVKAEVNRDFEIPGAEGAVLKAGRVMFKALPVDYVESMKSKA